MNFEVISTTESRAAEDVVRAKLEDTHRLWRETNTFEYGRWLTHDPREAERIWRITMDIAG